MPILLILNHMLSPTRLGPASNVIGSVHRAAWFSVKRYQCNTPSKWISVLVLKGKNAAL